MVRPGLTTALGAAALLMELGAVLWLVIHYHPDDPKTAVLAPPAFWLTGGVFAITALALLRHKPSTGGRRLALLALTIMSLFLAWYLLSLLPEPGGV